MLSSNKKLKKKLQESYGKIKEDTFDFNSISQYFYNCSSGQSEQIISDRTYEDLDFDEFFMFVDRTSSKVGQQYLYNSIRTISSDPEFKHQEQLIKFYTENEKERVETQCLLNKLSKPEAAYLPSLFQKPHLSKPKWFKVVKPLSILSILLTIAVPFYPLIALFLLGLILVNFTIHFINKRNIIVYLKSLPQSIKLLDVAKNLGQLKANEYYFRKVKKDLEKMNKLKYKISFFQSSGGQTADLAVLASAILELIKMIYLLEPIFLFSTLDTLEKKRKEMKGIFDFVGQVDTCISIASLRSMLRDDWCVPTFDSREKKFSGEEMRHPLIPFSSRNTINLDSKSVILTGSNMSGKTTFIRTVGLNFVSALTLNTCFASSFTIKPSRLLTAIRISDDLMNDKSYYLDEVLTIKQMIEKSEEGNNLFLLDELFKGTNTTERIAAGKAVLSKLNANGNVVFVSTHDIELTDLLKEEFDSYHFCEQVDGKNVTFDYLLKHGKLKEKNAIKILAANGYPHQVTEEASNLASKLG